MTLCMNPGHYTYTHTHTYRRCSTSMHTQCQLSLGGGQSVLKCVLCIHGNSCRWWQKAAGLWHTWLISWPYSHTMKPNMLKKDVNMIWFMVSGWPLLKKNLCIPNNSLLQKPGQEKITSHPLYLSVFWCLINQLIQTCLLTLYGFLGSSSSLSSCLGFFFFFVQVCAWK